MICLIENVCKVKNFSYSVTLRVILWVMSSTIIVKELYQLKTAKLKYFLDIENYVQWSLLFVMAITFIPVLQTLNR